MKDIYTINKETQLAHIYEPEPGLFIAESPKVIMRALDAGYEPESFLIEEGMEDDEAKNILQRCPNVPVYREAPETMKSLRGYELTRGMLSAMRRKMPPHPEDLLNTAKRILVLEEVENPTNVGAIFRSAAAIGLDAVLLTKGCADPLYRRAARVSMGNVFNIPWTYIEDANDVQKFGFKTAALALRDNTIDITDKILKNENKLAIILGTEGEGLKDKTIESADYAVKIPMKEGVDSFNVSVAAAIAMWEIKSS